MAASVRIRAVAACHEIEEYAVLPKNLRCNLCENRHILARHRMVHTCKGGYAKENQKYQPG